MPLCAGIRRSLERKLLIFLGLGFFFEPEGRGLRATLRVAKPSQPKAARESLPARQFYRCGSRIRQVSEANRQIPPGAPLTLQPRSRDSTQRAKLALDPSLYRNVNAGASVGLSKEPKNLGTTVASPSTVIRPF